MKGKLLVALVALLLSASSAMAASPTQTATFVLSWLNGAVLADNSNAPTGVKVERKIGAGAYVQIQLAGVVQTYTDVVASDPGNTAYCFRVRETNAVGDSAYSNEACATTPVVSTPPPTPSNLIINLQVK